MKATKNSVIRSYVALTKPGIIRGNLLTAAAGFFLAANGHVDYTLLLGTLTGTALVIGSACVFNNYIDRDIDALMARTKERALVQKSIRGQYALLYGGLLGIIGMAVLGLLTNPLTVSIGFAGFILYVLVYGDWKRRSFYGTHIGSLSGALPPVAGYCAVTGRIDGAAITLFLIMICWQMPHFFAIAMYRRDDYAAAGVPVLPVVLGMRTAKVHILLYVVAFMFASLLLSILGYTGYVYAVSMAVLSAIWLWQGLRGFNDTNEHAWGRSMFLFSLIVISLQSLLIALNSLIV